MRLTIEQRHKRLAFDYMIVMRMQSPVMQVAAYRNPDDLKARRNAITSEGEGYLATHYLADYNITTLTAKDRYSKRTSVHFDLLANHNDYPFSEPSCWVIQSELPWSPHFKKGSPICIGELWRDARGEILLGHLLIHIAKLLNFDEVARHSGYVGWNGEAIAYWRNKLKEQPITPGLVYPVLPVDITHDDFEDEAPKAQPTFNPVGEAKALAPAVQVFRAKQHKPTLFRGKVNP